MEKKKMNLEEKILNQFVKIEKDTKNLDLFVALPCDEDRQLELEENGTWFCEVLEKAGCGKVWELTLNKRNKIIDWVEL